ncbi:MAG: hypothetical protein WCA13_18445 [Terriglobales bacterium]
MNGLFKDFTEQFERYQGLNRHIMELEARLELAEKTLCLTRDHLAMALKSTEGSENRLQEFLKQSAKVRFVGMRLTDACTAVLQEHRKLTPAKLLDAVNEGTFRFRTNAPLREIHAALLRHPHINREGDYYVWTAPKEEQIPMQLRIPRKPKVSTEAKQAILSTEEKPN